MPEAPLPRRRFATRIAKAYESGAGWLLCMNAQAVQSSKDVMQVDLGVDNIDYLVFERKEVMSRTENTASINFGTHRKGVASWHGAPGPLSTLDFVSPEAGAAVDFVMKNPRQAVEELLTGIRQRNPNVDQQITEHRSDSLV